MSLHVHSRDATTVFDHIPWGELEGVRVGIVLWAGLAVLDVVHLAAAPPYAGLGALAILVTVASVGTRTTTALCSAVTGWLLVDGFVEHRYGSLAFHPLHDLPVLALLMGLALAATRTRR